MLFFSTKHLLCSGSQLLPVFLLLAFSPSDAMAEPNDVWAAAIDIGSSRSVSDRLDFATPGADTTLGLFDEAGALILSDDDGSFFGNGLASAFVDQPINEDGSVRFAVSGFGDYDFDGADDLTGSGHVETGDFDVFLTVYGSDGRVLASDDFSGTLVPGEAVQFPPVMAPEWLGGTFDLELNNFFGPASDVDFWQFSELPVGARFVAEVVESDFDTLLGRYNDVGQLIDSDDDGGAPPLSRLEGVTPPSGKVYFAVTAFPDFNYGGIHSVTGEYTLRLTVVPEPACLVVSLLAISLALPPVRPRRSMR